jgi:superfamily I DNA/RNA helicase
MTRAMSLLYLTYARSRAVGEEMKEHSPSRFLASIPKHLTKVVSATERGATLPPMEMEPTLLAIPMVEA